MLQKKKRFSLLVLAALMLGLVACVYMLPSQADTAPSADSWAASADVTWYSSADTTFYISTPEQLAGVAALVNAKSDDFDNDTIILSNDIDLDGKSWAPIGTTDTLSFKGTFNGQGYSVNITSMDSGLTNAGLFGYIASADIKNVVTTGAISGSYASVGALVGYANNSKIANIINKATIINNTTSYIGGIAGNLSASSMDNVMNLAAVSKISNSGGDSHVGGIAGSVAAASTLTSAINKGQLNSSGTSYIGGVAGVLNNTSTIVSSINIGAVSGDTGVTIGGIIGLFGDPTSVSIPDGTSIRRANIFSAPSNGIFNCAWLRGTADKGVGKYGDGTQSLPVKAVSLDNFDGKAVAYIFNPDPITIPKGGSAAAQIFSMMPSVSAGNAISDLSVDVKAIDGVDTGLSVNGDKNGNTVGYGHTDGRYKVRATGALKASKLTSDTTEYNPISFDITTIVTVSGDASGSGSGCSSAAFPAILIFGAMAPFFYNKYKKSAKK